MKHAVILLDGMADYPIPSLGEKTPLAYADTPNMDYMFQNGWGGMVKNVPPGLAPESAVANLSVLGYDPETVFTGRSPLEAASMGVVLKDTDITARCNLVTLSDEPNYEDKTILDYCADEIGSAEARELVFALNEHNREKDMHFYPGISYRNLMVWNNGPTDLELVPPHDITGKPIAGYLPANARLLDVMRQSHTLLKDHPVNLDRIKKGLRPANSVWFWGAGKKTVLQDFMAKYGKKGAVIGAVDLIRGIGISAGMEVIEVPGATGNFHTNYKGKGEACIRAFREGFDFVFIHIEAPDECGHRGELENKVKSIELIDSHIIGPILAALEDYSAFKIMALADHPTPLALKTHTREAVPFVVYGKGCNSHMANRSERTSDEDPPGFTEENAKKTGILFDKGTLLMEEFIKQCQ